jgi:hypothetical protein
MKVVEVGSIRSSPRVNPEEKYQTGIPSWMASLDREEWDIALQNELLRW